MSNDDVESHVLESILTRKPLSTGYRDFLIDNNHITRLQTKWSLGVTGELRDLYDDFYAVHYKPNWYKHQIKTSDLSKASAAVLIATYDIPLFPNVVIGALIWGNLDSAKRAYLCMSEFCVRGLYKLEKFWLETLPEKNIVYHMALNNKKENLTFYRQRRDMFFKLNPEYVKLQPAFELRDDRDAARALGHMGMDPMGISSETAEAYIEGAFSGNQIGILKAHYGQLLPKEVGTDMPFKRALRSGHSELAAYYGELAPLRDRSDMYQLAIEGGNSEIIGYVDLKIWFNPESFEDYFMLPDRLSFNYLRRIRRRVGFEYFKRQINTIGFAIKLPSRTREVEVLNFLYESGFNLWSHAIFLIPSLKRAAAVLAGDI